MRWTEQNPDIRDVAPDEVWVGVIPADKPYVAIATRDDDADNVVIVFRLGPADARGMAAELLRLAAEIDAPNN